MVPKRTLPQQGERSRDGDRRHAMTAWDPSTGSRSIRRERVKTVKTGEVVTVVLEPAEMQIWRLGIGYESKGFL